MCVGGQNVNQRTTISSVQSLGGGQFIPRMVGNDIADPKAIWYFSESNPKKVSLVLVENFGNNNQFTMDLGPFAQNMAQGRKLGILLEGEYYYISHPIADQVTPAQVTAYHIPTLTPFPARAVGGNWYQLDVLGGKSIAFRIDAFRIDVDSKTVVFQSLSAGEQLRA